MASFEDFNLNRALNNALADLKLTTPTQIQENSFSVILSGKDVVGISQTGTGKTFAYLLPILQQLKFSEQKHPRVLIMVPTRELVEQVTENIKALTAYISIRIVAIYGETNINVQRQALAQGCDIVVATPGRLYDLALSHSVSLKEIKKLVIDEVDVMLDLGFLPQLTSILDLLPERRQNIMFSATMTEEVEELIDTFFNHVAKISVAVSGTPLQNIEQQCYPVLNFNTKVNLLAHLLSNKQEFKKVIVFVGAKSHADTIFDQLSDFFGVELAVIHANKSQNQRLNTIAAFEKGEKRILIATDVIARGIDLDSVTHVISFDVPKFPENYIHRIGRTGRLENQGHSILLFTETEVRLKVNIEALMKAEIKQYEFPEEVEINHQLIVDEKPRVHDKLIAIQSKIKPSGPSVHEKKIKNQKVNLGGSYKAKLEAKYKKPKTRGDKNANKKKRGR